MARAGLTLASNRNKHGPRFSIDGSEYLGWLPGRSANFVAISVGKPSQIGRCRVRLIYRVLRQRRMKPQTKALGLRSIRSLAIYQLPEEMQCEIGAVESQ